MHEITLRSSEVTSEGFIFSVFFSEKIREMNSDYNCTTPCQNIIYEPSLSYAVLSEFNIDRVVLTDPVRHKAVKDQVELSVETRQRVVNEIKEEDEEVIGALINTAMDLQMALAKTTEMFGKPDLLAKSYGIYDEILDAYGIPVTVSSYNFKLTVFFQMYKI